jgi:hypothetical protein
MSILDLSFLGNHEWCFYVWRTGAAHRYFGPRNATDVWSVKKVHPQAMVHLAEKPVELAVRSHLGGSKVGRFLGRAACHRRGASA